MVNEYAIPTYKEINPGIYLIITFPFLFGVMYGDIGHGACLLFVATVLVLFSSRLERIPAMKDIVTMRYFLFLMGFFAVFCGLMYNDFMSLPLYLFKSCYDKTGMQKKDCVYPAGIDPAWYGAQKEINFINSLKMKVSVILGVSHMLLGQIQKGLNARYFKNSIDFWHVFVP